MAAGYRIAILIVAIGALVAIRNMNRRKQLLGIAPAFLTQKRFHDDGAKYSANDGSDDSHDGPADLHPKVIAKLEAKANGQHVGDQKKILFEALHDPYLTHSWISANSSDQGHNKKRFQYLLE